MWLTRPRWRHLSPEPEETATIVQMIRDDNYFTADAQSECSCPPGIFDIRWLSRLVLPM